MSEEEGLAPESGDEETSEEVVGGEEAEATEPEGNEEPSPQEPAQQELQFTPEQQELINSIVGSKVSKTKQIETELQKTREELVRLRQQVPEDKPPVVPEIPDAYDPDFSEKVAARDAAIKARFEFEQRQRQTEEQQRTLQQQAYHQQQQEMQMKAEQYKERATAKGIRPEELQLAGQAIFQAGISEAVAKHILGDPEGPSIAVHLAKNLAELHKLSQLDPMSAAAHLALNVKPKLQGTMASGKPPSVTLTGGGVPVMERGPKGATYE